MKMLTYIDLTRTSQVEYRTQKKIKARLKVKKGSKLFGIVNEDFSSSSEVEWKSVLPKTDPRFKIQASCTTCFNKSITGEMPFQYVCVPVSALCLQFPVWISVRVFFRWCICIFVSVFFFLCVCLHFCLRIYDLLLVRLFFFSFLSLCMPVFLNVGIPGLLYVCVRWFSGKMLSLSVCLKLCMSDLLCAYRYILVNFFR